jgi:hypothetical protein
MPDSHRAAGVIADIENGQLGIIEMFGKPVYLTRKSG